MRRTIFNYLAWLFFPSRFLFPNNTNRVSTGHPPAPPRIPIPWWETLELKTDPDELKAFNRRVGKDYLGGAGNEFLVPLFGNQSAFTLDGSQHLLARKLISQSVNKPWSEHVARQVPSFLDREWQDISVGDRVRAGRVMRRITMRTMCLAILGSTDETLFEKLLSRFEAATGYFANLVSYNKTFWHSGSRLSVGAEVKRRKDGIDAIIFNLIESRRSERPDFGKEDISSNDLLSHLVRHQSEYGYSDEFIRDNLVSTLAAGYDTSGAAITWMLFWLNKDDHSRQTLSAAYRTASADYALYAEAFVSETMRYCPPLEIMPRRPVALQSGVKPSDSDEPTLVCPCPHRVHHNRTIYGDPEHFRPARFMEQKFTSTQYFPFGLGSRLCLGIILAPKVMRVVLDWFVDREVYLQFHSKRFRPIRRNVSLWPSFSTKAKVAHMHQ